MPTMHATVTRGDDEIEIEIDYTVARFHAAETYGLPEHCSPAEGGEVEELDAFRDGEPFELTADEAERIEQRIYETHDYSE